MANMLDMPMFRLDSGAAPLNFDQIKKILDSVQNQKGRLDDANQDTRELTRQLEKLKDEQYNQASLG